MEIWIVAAVAWSLTLWFSRRFSRPRRDEYLRRIPLREFLKFLSGIALLVPTLGAVVLSGVALMPASLPSFFAGASRLELLGVAFTLSGSIVPLWMFLLYSDIVVTEDGIYLFHEFAGWNQITEIRESGRLLRIRVSHTQGKTRELSVLVPLWDFTPDVIQFLQKFSSRSATPHGEHEAH